MTAEYDFKSHAVFEASAGTGKTYQIGQLVVQAVADQGVPLQKILVVTYTEKAAGELKERLRAALEEEAKTEAKNAPGGDRLARLQKALSDYDEARIFTIHAFCLRVLRQNPFSHAYGGRAAMADDKDVLATCLRHVQRAEWKKNYGGELVPMLDLSGFTNARSGGEDWENDLEQVARSFRPACGHELRPAPAENAAAALKALAEKIRAAITQSRELTGPLPAVATDHPLMAAYEKFPMQEKWLESRRRDVLVPLLRWLDDPESINNPVASFSELLVQCSENGKFSEIKFTALTDTKKPIPTEFDNLRALVELLNPLCGELAKLEYQLTVATVTRVAATMHEHKLEHGLQSFDDFLTRVDLALKNDSGGGLLKKLRDTYQIAIVDEFQDTDPVQWDIFRRVFVDENDPARKLIIVGDPKQAIYGFRNADVHTYLAAREHITKTAGNPPRHLARNYRSSKDMVAALNIVFKDGGMFPASGQGSGSITYEEVGCAPDDKRSEIIGEDRSGRKALTLARFNGVEKATDARRVMAQFVGAEIARLLRGGGKNGPAFSYKTKKNNRPLQADDIGVLVFTKKEAAPIEDQLRARGIPCSFYKKKGIWQSEEALHLGFVLKALARAGDAESFRKMLLTRFVGLRPGQIPAFENTPGDNTLRELFKCWRQQAARRCWAEMFRSILQDTGTFWTEAAAPDGARRLANHRHIIRKLAHEAYENGLALPDLVELLKDLRLHSSEDESGVHPLETEKPAVQIMTVHASKGLEFPVVFLAGGFTSAMNRAPFRKYHEGEKLVFQMNKNDKKAKDAEDLEEEAEARRLLYVALTRAMLKLYLPHPAKYPRGSGPLIDVLRPVLDAAKPENRQELCGIVTATWDRQALPVENSNAETAENSAPAPKKIGFADFKFEELSKRCVEVRSFSRIVRHHTRPDRFAERDPHDDDTPPLEKIADALPAGIAAGDTLHAVLERVDFGAAAAAATPADLLAENTAPLALIKNSVERFLGAADKTQPEKERNARLPRVAELVFNTLRAPLPALEGAPLSALASSDRLHELEFHMPFDMQSAKIDGINNGENGFLTGCMDLVFRHQNRWFLLDWKSNTLPDYAQDSLAQAMRDQHYDLQFRIYLQALKRWLQRVNPNVDLKQEFGGVFYMFMRGINENNAEQGVWFHQPEANDWDAVALARDLQRELSGRRNG
jgi:exodeoxyribonuclease V beta subunit